MAIEQVDGYLAEVPEPQRSTLQQVRSVLERLLPDAEQALSYGVPTFKGKGVAGFASFKKHCGYLPMSGSVTAALAEQLEGYSVTKGSVQFPIDQPLPESLIRVLVEARLGELGFDRD